ncbi:MAG: hypothetical protein AAF226_12505, partial [Verrucomicrobiota bacterium]
QKDITFIRSTSNSKGQCSWIGAATPRFKLILSPIEQAWLFDLQEEPDELLNHIDKPEHRSTVRMMAKQIQNYAKATGDRYIENEQVAAQLEALVA